MPIHPAENLPASFRKHNVTVNKYIENLKELKINEQLKEGKTKGYMKISSSDKLVSTGVPGYILPSNLCINKSSKQTGVSFDFQLPKHIVVPFIFTCKMACNLIIGACLSFIWQY